MVGGIWLNEAFATFMETSCSDAYRPTGESGTRSRARSAAFDVDALASTRPIEFPVVTPQEAEGMFDLLTYEKGASVVRMLEQYLGAEVFRDGVRHYLETHSYANTETTDLWASLETISGQPVQSLMHDWIYQGGHPIITATATPHGLRVEQRAFTLDPNVADDRTWSVPLVIRHDGETTSALLTEGSMLLTGITGTPTTVNAGAAGFFRTAIDEAILADLEASGPGDRTPTERHGLVDDAWALTVAGSLSAADFLRLARALAGEDDLNVWQALATGLHGLDRLVEGAAADVLASIIRELAGPTLASIGFEPGDDDDRTLELRATLVRLLGTAGNDGSDRRRTGAVNHPDASLGAAALTVVAHHGGQAEYDTIRAAWLDATDPVTEIRNQRALAGFRSVELVEQLLGDIADGTVRTQDAPYLIARALGGRTVARRVWDFVTTNWDDLDERFPSNSIPRMLSGVTALDEPDLVEAVASFLDDHPIPQAGKQVDQHLERQRINAAFRAREAERLTASPSKSLTTETRAPNRPARRTISRPRCQQLPTARDPCGFASSRGTSRSPGSMRSQPAPDRRSQAHSHRGR